MSYICNKAKVGRPKTTSVYPTADFGTKQLQEKREKYGLDANNSKHEPLTCLFILWSKKCLSYEQFVAGCYVEELLYRLRRSSGSLQGNVKTSLARLKDGEVKVVRNKLPSIGINERVSSMLSDVRDIVSLVHPNAMGLLERLMTVDDFEFIHNLEKGMSIDMKVIHKCLDMIDVMIKKHMSMQQEMLSVERYGTYM